MKKILKYALLVIIMLVFIYILYLICKPLIEETERLQSKTYKINDVMDCKSNKYKVTVTNIKILDHNDYIEIPKNNELVAIYLKVENYSNKDLSFSEKNLKLINSNNEEISPLNGTIQDMWSGNRLNNFVLKPNGAKTGYIVFSNTNLDNSDLKATYNCNESWQYNISLK